MIYICLELYSRIGIQEFFIVIQFIHFILITIGKFLYIIFTNAFLRNQPDPDISAAFLPNLSLLNYVYNWLANVRLLIIKVFNR